ncbi:MAG: sulfite exporter TauE/SafE family protein [Flavobacteriaceae bacterium]|nr:sulfite exporter TauE/SafE family protein [Bacteroidia bacterium]MBT8288536.1 sulfite exporter TauE/SafE family protein [Bacteroidia bacterium]NNF74832.1 sulfite exporter TauE/SafE family protein [Flavobacteriaceae bacterium]NNK73408.1 sulfite exporter TauE/SafE family protein [Flavobacteriaceae bacterium]
MTYLIICIVAFLASILTFFSGFGLGTILLPVFAFFFPIEVAIALTGVVHFFNNMFKLTLVGKNAKKKVLLLFGIPAVIAAFLGAFLLVNLTDIPTLTSYILFNKTFEITLVNVVIGLLLIVFAIIELTPFFNRLKFEKKHLPFGGILSGFFGGLSGHQGALRSAFLINAGLTKEAFIGTAVVISSFIDITRLSVYSTRVLDVGLMENYPLVLSATLSAMAGAFIGNRLLKKITLDLIHKIVAVLLILISILIGLGII